MKKISNFLLILGFALAASCSDDFLEIYPETTSSEGNFYQSEKEFILLANGCYTPMRDYEKDTHWVLSELISDNTSFQFNTRTGEAVRGVIDQFIFTPANRAYSRFWDLSYDGITRCNKLLSEIERPEVVWSDDSIRNRTIGEALFLRALYNFNLVRQFGDIPLVLEPITPQEAFNTKRSAEDLVYESIIADLQSAITHFENATGILETGRANGDASAALLGKVYLTRKNYTEAEAVLASLINGGTYSLVPNYSDVFNSPETALSEIIFAIQYSENSRELSNRFIFMFAPWTSGGEVTGRPNINIISAGWNQPTVDIIEAFEPGDLRKEVSVKFWTGSDYDDVIRDIPYIGKYNAPVSAPDDRTGDNLPILRYSDVLLMYAEVLNELGRTDEAITFVEQVRNRAGLDNSLASISKPDLERLIAKERQVELCFENHRWYDLKRTGKAIEVMSSHGIRQNEEKSFLFNNAYEIIPYKLLAPIPAEQILVNELNQNPGY
ncbi:RagB/SusD family nutrient uptake outer membrane protein [uncultured Zobellia sp.]|uniref:RagB/SusD family nutrient uptake outer membrane protein n=1 Tax=uncultured Zobellia sp. TaxID=255433 RepID=UPI0025976718|nr:RagB/SusD family nutrient uptake outer membrane protein [uncultured Zobellia sp.]